MAAAKDIQLVFATLIADATGLNRMGATRKPLLRFRKSVRQASTPEIQVSLDEKFINQYLRLLTELPKRMQKKVLQSALLFAARPLRADARANAKRTSDTVARAIASGVMKRLAKGRAGVKVGVARKKGSDNDPWFAHFIEFGTAPHGNHPGTSSEPFLRPAFDGNKAVMLERIAVRLGTGLEKEINRVLKRGKL